MLKLGLIFIVLVFILFVIFKILFKLASPIKTLGIALIVSIIIFALIVCVMYINDIDYDLLGSGKEYITGEVVSKNGKELRIRVIEHNLNNGLERNKTVTIKVTNDTALRHQTRVLFETTIEFKEIEIGDKVNVICSDIKNSDITAQKVVVKY